MKLPVCFISLIVACSVLTCSARGQANEEVVDTIERFMEALGGRMLLESIESLEVTVEFSGGTNGTVRVRYLDGKSCQDVKFGDSSYRQGFDGKHWWANSEIIKDADRVEKHESVYYLPTEAMRWLQHVDRFEVAGREEYADGEFAHCTCLKTSSNKYINHRYFDPATDLMVGMQRFKLKDGEFEREFNCTFEYEEVEGLTVVTRSRRTNTNGWSADCRYTGYKLDPELDPAQFRVEMDDD